MLGFQAQSSWQKSVLALLALLAVVPLLLRLTGLSQQYCQILQCQILPPTRPKLTPLSLLFALQLELTALPLLALERARPLVLCRLAVLLRLARLPLLASPSSPRGACLPLLPLLALDLALALLVALT